MFRNAKVRWAILATLACFLFAGAGVVEYKAINSLNESKIHEEAMRAIVKNNAYTADLQMTSMLKGFNRTCFPVRVDAIEYHLDKTGKYQFDNLGIEVVRGKDQDTLILTFRNDRRTRVFTGPTGTIEYVTASQKGERTDSDIGFGNKDRQWMISSLTYNDEWARYPMLVLDITNICSMLKKQNGTDQPNPALIPLYP